MTSRRLLAIGLGTALLAPFALPSGVVAQTPAPPASVITWLDSQQQADGGFDLAGLPGFETPDAIAAFAATSHQTRWDAAAARARVQQVTTNGADPFDAVDALVDGVADPATDAAGAQAAKVVALVAGPTGISATDFDPAGDSDDPVDLVARMDVHRAEDGSYDFGAQFNGTLYAALALDALDQPIPDGLVDQIVDAQRTDGSWNYAGDQDAETAGDIDTSSLALLALAAAGLDHTDPTVADGIEMLAAGQQASGAWQFFGADDPNSTSMAAIALSGLQIDVTDAQWVRPFGATPRASYTSPYTWLRTQVNAQGRVVSPNDEYGVNTLATSQALQALSNQWHLRQERVDLIAALAEHLATSSTAAAGTGDTMLGANASTRSAREAAAHAVAMSQAGRETAAESLFQRAFGRSLDAGGRAYWSGELVTDARSRVLARLTGSAEFYERSGGTTATFVENAYQVVLGRGPDTAGRAYWEARIDGGAAVESVALDLVSSREYRAKEVDVAYQQMLGRNADAGGRAFWTDRLATTRVEAILAGIGGSAEFYRLHS